MCDQEPPKASHCSGADIGWLPERHLEELGSQLQFVWDVYIKWYTVFLTTNVVALGAVVQYVQPENRKVLILAFVIQNILGTATAYHIAAYSRRTSRLIQAFKTELVCSTPAFVTGNCRFHLTSEPLLGDLAYWCGNANAMGNLTLATCWLALAFIPAPTREKTEPSVVSVQVVAPASKLLPITEHPTIGTNGVQQSPSLGKGVDGALEDVRNVPK